MVQERDKDIPLLRVIFATHDCGDLKPSFKSANKSLYDGTWTLFSTDMARSGALNCINFSLQRECAARPASEGLEGRSRILIPTSGRPRSS